MLVSYRSLSRDQWMEKVARRINMAKNKPHISGNCEKSG